jgi:hypothetical protein
MALLIKAERTGRKSFGDKQDGTKSTITVSGVKLTLTAADTWSSGEYAGDGEYIRCTWLDTQTQIDPWPNLKMPTPTKAEEIEHE